jgi:hypothetical protein
MANEQVIQSHARVLFHPYVPANLDSNGLILSSVADLSIASTMVNRGIVSAPMPLLVTGRTLIGAVVLSFIMDTAKVLVFEGLRLSDLAPW